MSEWIVNRDEIINAVDDLSLVPSRPGIVTSEYIRVTSSKNKIRMSMTSEISGYSEATGKGRWPFDKTIYIDRRIFDPFITTAKNIKSKAEFIFSKSGKNELSISNGHRKVKLSCSDKKSGYNELGKTSGHEVKVEKALSTLLLAAKHCAETETAEPEKNCVYARKSGKYLILYATTGILNIRCKIKNKLYLKEPLPFPLYIIDLLSSDRLVGIESTKHDVVLDFKSGKIWQTISVPAKKKFPWKQIDKLIDNESKKSKLGFVVEAKQFGLIIDRLAGYLGSVRRLDWVLQLKGRKDSSRLETIVPLGHTTFKDKIKVRKPITFDFSVDLPFDRILGVLEVIASTGEKVYWNFDKDNRSYVKTSGIELLISRRTN
jgi:DNA polymerase III sliding clamp (beta) subunit (PCNA family)